ncbi:MAG: VanZ family protein [Planctomycetota bacterium]
MNTSQPLSRLSPWDHWYRRALPSYWIFLFCVTHFPKLTLDIGFPQGDKMAHAVAYALLAFLFWRFFQTFGLIRSATFVWWAALWIGLYAALDEWLQPFVNRSGDVWDWVLDMVGAVCVLVMLELRRRKTARKETSPSHAGD